MELTELELTTKILLTSRKSNMTLLITWRFLEFRFLKTKVCDVGYKQKLTLLYISGLSKKTASHG